MDLIEVQSYALAKSIEEITAELLSLPQARIDVIHKFIPGYYIREMRASKNTMIMGAHHNFETLNVFVSGKGLFRLSDGSVKEMIAPSTFVSDPGAKAVYVLEDLVWQNVWKTDITDVAVLELYLFRQDEVPQQVAFNKYMQQWERHELDREDFLKAIEELGFTEQEVQILTENEADQVPLPYGDYKFIFDISAINGMGTICTADIEEGEIIGISRIGNMRTPLGRYINHSANPNAKGIYKDNNIYVVATKHIKGDGSTLNGGEEITVDYRESVKLSRSIEE